MKWEELTTPEAVIASFEAGRHVEYMAPTRGGRGAMWLSVRADAALDLVGDLVADGYIFRALIEEPAIPACDNASGEWCEACRKTGLSHCSDPANCGGMKPMRHHVGCAHGIPAGFTPWYGGECPEEVKGVPVEYILRPPSSVHNHIDGSELRWSHVGDASDIVAYRVESAQPKPEPEPSDVEALTLQIIDAQPFAAENDATRVWQLFGEPNNARKHLAAIIELVARRLRPQDSIELDIGGIGCCQLQVRDGVAFMPAVTVRDIVSKSGLAPQVGDAMTERRARAFLAREYERDGCAAYGANLRDGPILDKDSARAVRAICAALTAALNTRQEGDSNG